MRRIDGALFKLNRPLHGGDGGHRRPLPPCLLPKESILRLPVLDKNNNTRPSKTFASLVHMLRKRDLLNRQQVQASKIPPTGNTEVFLGILAAKRKTH